jgi:hypothetical protein
MLGSGKTPCASQTRVESRRSPGYRTTRHRPQGAAEASTSRRSDTAEDERPWPRSGDVQRHHRREASRLRLGPPDDQRRRACWRPSHAPTVIQQNTWRQVPFEIAEPTQEAPAGWPAVRVDAPPTGSFGRSRRGDHITNRQYARLGDRRAKFVDLEPSAYGTHSLRWTKVGLRPRSDPPRH